MDDEKIKELKEFFDELVDLDNEFNLQGYFILKCLKKIICLLRQKVCIEEKNFPLINNKLDKIIELLTRKVRQENTIIDRLDTLIEQLQTKIDLETPQPAIECKCTVSGTGTGDVPPGTGVLNIDVCEDCTIAGSKFNYQVFNPANQSVREIISVTFTDENCDLDEAGTGIVTMTGTALVRSGVGGPFRSAPFVLLLNVETFSVISFTITARNIEDTVVVTTDKINVKNCLNKKI